MELKWNLKKGISEFQKEFKKYKHQKKYISGRKDIFCKKYISWKNTDPAKYTYLEENTHVEIYMSGKYMTWKIHVWKNIWQNRCPAKSYTYFFICAFQTIINMAVCELEKIHTVFQTYHCTIYLYQVSIHKWCHRHNNLN